MDRDMPELRMLKSPFVEQRKSGVLPQDIAPEIADPLVEKVLSIPEDAFLEIGPVTPYTFAREKGVFEAKQCSKCNEMAFVDKLVDDGDGPVCMGCREEAS